MDSSGAVARQASATPVPGLRAQDVSLETWKGEEVRPLRWRLPFGLFRKPKQVPHVRPAFETNPVKGSIVLFVEEY